MTEYLNTKDFSTATGLSTKLISKYLREGTLKGEKKSGKWQIPKSELDSPVAKGEAASAPAGEKKPQPTPAKTSAPSAGSLSVCEFAQKTYLTEKGVIEWIAKGRISANKDKNGEWQVSSASLEDPALERLLR